MIDCVSRDGDYCTEFDFKITRDTPCYLCPYIERPKKDKKKKEEKDG